MLFNSPLYGVFLFVTYVTFWALRRKQLARTIFLVAASYVFYFVGTYDAATEQDVPLGPIGWTLLCVAIIFFGSTLDYFVGRALGRRKLIPSVSPGKTVAGAMGGLVASMLVAWLYARSVLVPVASLGLTPWGALGFGATISVAAQIGDLFESLLKREARVKDSSHIIPGHGGILDRFDSLIFVLPVAYLLLGWLPIPIVR
jgi:CDP-diglyceride synthetase